MRDFVQRKLVVLMPAAAAILLGCESKVQEKSPEEVPTGRETVEQRIEAKQDVETFMIPIQEMFARIADSIDLVQQKIAVGSSVAGRKLPTDIVARALESVKDALPQKDFADPTFLGEFSISGDPSAPQRDTCDRVRTMVDVRWSGSHSKLGAPMKVLVYAASCGSNGRMLEIATLTLTDRQEVSTDISATNIAQVLGVKEPTLDTKFKCDATISPSDQRVDSVHCHDFPLDKISDDVWAQIRSIDYSRGGSDRIRVSAMIFSSDGSLSGEAQVILKHDSKVSFDFRKKEKDGGQ